MNITQRRDGTTLHLALSGRLDAIGAITLEKEMKQAFKEMADAFKPAKRIELDFAETDYLSSAGLRVLLSTAKYMKHVSGTTHLLNLSPQVLSTLQLTGLASSPLLTIVQARV